MKEKIILKNDKMIKCIQPVVFLGNNEKSSEDISVTKEEYLENRNGEFDNYKYISLEYKIFTTNNLIYVFGVRCKIDELKSTAYACCIDLENQEIYDVVADDFMVQNQDGTIHVSIKDENGILTDDDIIRIQVLDDDIYSFTMVENDKQDNEKDNIKSFVGKYFV